MRIPTGRGRRKAAPEDDSRRLALLARVDAYLAEAKRRNGKRPALGDYGLHFFLRTREGAIGALRELKVASLDRGGYRIFVDRSGQLHTIKASAGAAPLRGGLDRATPGV